jgi:hypothetical protein
MSKLKFIKEPSLERLQANIIANEEQYSKDSPWLDSYFAGTNWFTDSDIPQLESIQLEIPTSKTELRDLENTRILYSALKHLTPVQASDPRLWAYFTHVSHWEYMRARWPVEQYSGKDRFKEIMQERYFFMPDRSRALLRNGMARLWWYGYSSYDETRKDPFELTGPLLKKLDVTQTLLENAFGRNTQITKAVLSVLLERENLGKDFYVRDQVRDLGKYIGFIGGVTIIDALPIPELSALITGKIEQLAASAAV